MKYINQPLIINTNITLDEANECYFEALVEVEKLKKKFEIESPGNFIYDEWRKWDKVVENFLSAKFNLRVIPLAYVIRKDDNPVTIMFDDIEYDVDLEECRISAAPLTDAVFKIM